MGRCPRHTLRHLHEDPVRPRGGPPRERATDKEILWDDEITRSLADFQKVAVRQAIQMIRDHGGVFVSDVVGLGKSYIGAGIVKHFERTQNARPLIICPKPLVDMWEDYNETFRAQRPRPSDEPT